MGCRRRSSTVSLPLLFVAVALAALSPAAAAGVFNVKDNRSAIWRAEMLRLERQEGMAVERFVTSSSHGRRPLQTGGAPVDGPLPWELGFEFPMYRKAPSSSEDSSAAVKGGSAKTPKAPKTPQSPVSSLYDNCKPKPMPPCPEELSSDYKDYPIVFFNGVMCRNDFKTLAELVSGENAGRKAGDSSAVNPSAQSPAPSSETESSHKFVPLCSEVYNGYRPPPSPTTMAPVSSDELPWCPGPAPINPACPPGISDGSSSSESSNGSSGGTSGGSSGANKTSVPTPAATAGSGEGESSSISDRESSSSGSNGSGSGTSANTTSDDGNSTSSSESDNNTTTPTMTPDPDGPDFNGTYRPMVCVDGKALKRNVEYTLVLLNATYPGINNCAQQDSLPGLVTLQYYVDGNIGRNIIPNKQSCNSTGRTVTFTPPRAGILQINLVSFGGYNQQIDATCPVNGANVTTQTITASGPGLEVAFLNEKNPVTVCAKDTEGEPVYDTSLLVAPTFNLTILISPVNAVRNVSATIPIQNLPGCVNFTFTPTRLTQVNMSILWNFENIKDSPFAILVVDPGVKIDISNYNLWGPGTRGEPLESNSSYTIMLQPKAANGTNINDGGVLLQALQDGGAQASVNYGADKTDLLPTRVSYNTSSGRYSINYNTTRPGYLSISITARGKSTKGSPYVSVINGGAITARSICAGGRGTQFAIALTDNVINIRAQDVKGYEVYNDVLVIDGLSVIATDETGVAAETIFLEPLNGQPGQYRLHYLPTTAGSFRMTISFNNSNIVGCQGYGNSPYTIAVSPASPSARLSSVRVEDFSGAASSNPISALLQGPELLENHVNVDLSYTPISGYSEGLRPAPVDVKFERAEEDYMMVYTVRYIPSLPGKYTIDFKVDDEIIGTMKAEVSPAAPPELLSAQFEDSLVAVRITFDKDTNRARMVGRGACSQVLDDASIRQLGVGAACVWRDARQLVAYLSPDYSLRPDSEISIRPFALRGFLENDDYASGSIQVSGANKPSPVTAVLTGPNVLGSCDSLVLSALGTQGAGSGPLKYTWMVMAPESVDSDMNSVKHSLASHDAPTLELGPGVLPAGYTFVFSVRVTSIWGSRDTATLTVETERQPTRPSVHMQGPSVEYIDASQDLTLEGDASIPGSGCTGTSSMPSRSIGFEWSVVPEIYFHPTMRKALENPKLTVPSGLMLPGRSYTWTLVAKTLDGRATSSSSKVVNVVLPPLKTDGALGPNRRASVHSNLYLTAAPSDPLEKVMEVADPWTFQWSCLRRCWAAALECDPAVEGEPCGDMGLEAQQGDTSLVLAGAMEEGYRYMFQSLIARGPLFDGNGELQRGRVRITSVVIDAVDTNSHLVMGVKISGATPGGSINAHEPLVLECSSTPAAGSYFWELKRGDLPNGYTLNDIALSNSGFSSSGQQQLIIPSGILTPGQEIELSCSTISSDGKSSGEASLPLLVRPLPSGGGMVVYARESAGQAWSGLDPANAAELADLGTALVDSNNDGLGDVFVGNLVELRSLFRIAAVAWTYPAREVLGNEVQPSLMYQFFYRLGDSRRIPFTAMQASNVAEAMLPSGVVSLEVDIIGPGGVKTTHHHPLSILVNDDVQPEASSSRYAKLSALSGSQQQIYSNLVDEQKLERVLQFIRIWASSECNKGHKAWTDHIAQCGEVNDSYMVTMAKMAEDLLVLDRGHSLSSEYVELLSCSMAPLTCKASNVALSDQSPVIQLLDNMIQAALVQPSISLRTSMSCVQDLLEGLWLAAQAHCTEGSEAISAQRSTVVKQQLAQMTDHFAAAVSQDNVPGGPQLKSSGGVLDISTVRILSGASQIVLQANGISYNARVSGLPASSELCMASWVYKTSANTSSARHVAPLPAAGSHLAGVGPAFGFTAAVNCNQPLQSLPAVVTLSQDLAVPNPASTILGCWSDGTNYTYMLQNPGSSPGTLSASVTSSTPTGLCGWFYDKQGLEIAAASVRSEGEESKMIAIDDDGNGKGRKSGVLAGLAVIVVLLLAMIIAVPLLLLRRKRQQEAALRLQQQAAAGKRPLWDRQNEGTDTSSVALSSATLTSSQQMFPLATRPKHVSKYGLNTT